MRSICRMTDHITDFFLKCQNYGKVITSERTPETYRDAGWLNMANLVCLLEHQHLHELRCVDIRVRLDEAGLEVHGQEVWEENVLVEGNYEVHRLGGEAEQGGGGEE